VRAGRLRHRVIVQEAVESAVASGAVELAWQDSGTVWAEVEPLRGSRFLAARQFETAQSYLVRTRYLPGYRTNQRLRYLAEGTTEYMTLEITDVIDVNGRRRMVELMCRLVESDGVRNDKDV